MRAIRFSRFGGPEVLEEVEMPIPAPGAGQVLIRTRAAGINFFETLLRQNRYAATSSLPMIPGVEVAGTVETLGEGVRAGGLAVGARVAAPMFAANQPAGGYAEYVAVEADVVTPIPDGLSFEAATALMVQGLTALHLTRAVPPAGRTVLITAAAGGVGTLLIQLARRAGAKAVIAAASSQEKLALARALGANAGVDYTEPGWIEAVRAATGGTGPDVVYESAGGAITPASLAVLAPCGHAVIYGALNIQGFSFGVPELKRMVLANQSITGFHLIPLLKRDAVRAELGELFALAASGALKVALGAAYPLARASEAHAALEGRATTGKVVLVP